MLTQFDRVNLSSGNERTRGWRFAAVGALAFFSLIPAASAGAVGSFNESSCSGGGVTVGGTTIVWSPVGTVGGTGCINTGLGTLLTYSGGTLGAGVTGNIMNLTAGGGAVDQFMTFTGTTLDFVLTSLGPGSPNLVCAGLAVGASCSAVPLSPFILTNTGGGNTGVSLTAVGTIVDGGVPSTWFGSFTTQLTQSPDAVQSTI